MLLASDAVNAVGIRVRVLLLHVYLQGLLILVVPVTLGTLECLAGIVGGIPSQRPQPVGVDDHVTLATVQSSGSAIDVVRTGTNGGAL